MIWDDRLAEVWAEPGRAGAGVVIGITAVLTARHVVAGALDGGSVLARVVRPSASTAAWVRMDVLAEDATWDVAVLCVSDAGVGTDDSSSRWLEPLSRSPVFVRLGTSAAHSCEAVGFPQNEVQRAPDGSLASAVRQSEHVVGALLPAGQAKVPVSPDRPLPKRWIPFDTAGPTPATGGGWGGMSGAGVMLSDGRLAGLVVAAEAGHQQRRIYVVPFADVLTQSARIAAALDDPVVIEVRDAPLYRDVLQAGCLAPDGFPVLVREASYKTFGVKPAGVPGESAFLDYVPRDSDQRLRDGLDMAQAEHRVLLVAGGSAGGKSRSAAETARLRLPDHRLLCPRQGSLARLHELPIEDCGPVLVWLDDVERYEERAFRDTIDRLLRSEVVIVGTIRRTELDARMPKGDLRDPFGEALTDEELVVQVAWPVIWNDQERARVGERLRYPALLEWVGAGKSPTAWVVAGPALQDRLRNAEADDERPARYALARTVLDWYRTSIAQPMPLAAVSSLIQTYLPAEAEPADVEDALRWAFESVTGASRITRQSLLAKTPAGDAITVHDYIQDADTRANAGHVADSVWTAALEENISDDGRFAIGRAAAWQGQTDIASRAWLTLADRGDIEAMLNLGVLLADSDRIQARRWSQRAAEAGNIDAMVNLGVLLKDSDPVQARHWSERAAQAGDITAMSNLGWLLADSDPVQARHWSERAAEAGDAKAMARLGLLLKGIDPAQARRWTERAAEAGNTAGMYNLAVRLEYDDNDMVKAIYWWQRLAETGDASAMNHLAAKFKDTDPGSDPAKAIDWWQKLAETGSTDAMNNLGILLVDRDQGAASEWWRRAAESGHTGAMVNLGLLLKDSNPGQARDWQRRAAEAGDDRATFNL